ncbi:MAG: hypothetical protein JSV40_09315 [Deltaproteobacteria bacterium]|nr:MAG: hypothetical protein JSV40_09315 [Deltaproteobacteria bacterium]
MLVSDTLDVTVGNDMAKKRKRRKLDAHSAEKVDQILSEIETAQGQDTTNQKLLQNISSLLEKEPSLTIPLIEALARIPKPSTAQLLQQMIAEAADKAVAKSIKRALYKLRQRGVIWEEKPTRDKPILPPPKHAEAQGYLGAIDSMGSRIILAAKPQPLRGFLTVFSIVNDLEGIRDFTVREFSKKGLTEFVKSSLSSEDFPVVSAPGAYCMHLLKEASSVTSEASKTLPPGYHDAVDEFRKMPWDGPYPIIYQFINEEEVKDQVYLLKESVKLHDIMPFSTWFIPKGEVQEYASSIADAEESRIVLTADQKDGRINDIYMRALHDIFPEHKRLVWKKRLEEMAYILLQTGRDKEARLALCAALDLHKPFSSSEPNPFIWNLLLKSIHVLIGSEQEEIEEREKSSLIITP